MSDNSLTLRRRGLALNLPDRSLDLTLRRRSIALTLPNRQINAGETAANLARFAILQGFGGGFNRRVFLTYGLVGDLYDGVSTGTLTLRRRSIALTVEA